MLSVKRNTCSVDKSGDKSGDYTSGDKSGDYTSGDKREDYTSGYKSECECHECVGSRHVIKCMQMYAI